MEKDIPSKWNMKASRSGYTHICQTNLQTEIRRDKNGNFIMVKGIIDQEHITIIKINVPNVHIPKFIKQA
jgi:hypothetical protein